jgi:hypothetical protein
VAAGCGGNAQQSVEAEVIRADGSLVTFPQDVRAWCGHVVLGSEYHDLPTVSVAGSVVAEIER